MTESIIHYQLSPTELHKITLERNMGRETASGALAVNTGEFTGRSPKDRFIVKDDITGDKVWWGTVNIPFEPKKFDKLYDKVISYLDGKELYVRDCYACADANYRMNIRVINEYPWSNMFAYNMFIRPTKEELRNFEPEWTVVNAPGFMAIAEEDGTRQHNFAILNFTKKIALIGGTGYTGEIKKEPRETKKHCNPKNRRTVEVLDKGLVKNCFHSMCMTGNSRFVRTHQPFFHNCKILFQRFTFTTKPGKGSCKEILLATQR